MTDATAARLGQNRAALFGIGAAQESRLAWLLCRAGAVVCALAVEHVVEIMRLLPIERIAGAPKYVRGLSVIRGTPVPVVDLGLIISDRAPPATRLIAVRTATRTLALAVEAVTGISSVAADGFAQLPPLLRDAAADTVSAIAARDGELIIFLRAARLVPEQVLAQIDGGGAAA
jgi:purine-binding chemotaxis protein CheW